MSEWSIIPAAAPASLALAVNRIHPYRVIESWDGKQHITIYYFVRFKDKVTDRLPPHQSAMIVIPASKQSFTLSWFPSEEDAQVVVDLPMEQLSEAVNDLIGAGFK